MAPLVNMLSMTTIQLLSGKPLVLLENADSMSNKK